MVGKPNLPSDAEYRKDARGAAIQSLGLTALDQEREASMADEGGTAGACMESQDGEPPLKSPLRSMAQLAGEVPWGQRRPPLGWAAWLALSLGAFCLGGLLGWRSRAA